MQLSCISITFPWTRALFHRAESKDQALFPLGKYLLQQSVVQGDNVHPSQASKGKRDFFCSRLPALQQQG